MADRVRAGSVWVNDIHRSHHAAPFGGMKESGIGREKGRWGVESYLEHKTVYLSYEERAELGILTTGERTQPTLPGVEETVVQTRQGPDVPADPPSLDSSSPTLFDTSGAPKEPSLLERAGVTDAEKPAPARNTPAIKPA